MPKRTASDALAKVRAVAAFLREAEAFAVEQYAYILAGKPEPATPGLSAEGKAREAEEAATPANGKASGDRGKKLATKAASWRGLEKMGEVEILPYIFQALERRQWDAEFALIAGKRHPLATGLLAGDLLQTIGQLADAATAGDEQALRSLRLVANEATIQLDRASRAQPSAARTLAQTLQKWPAFVGPHGDNVSEGKRLIKELQIGSKSPLSLKGRWSDKPSPGQPYRHLVGQYLDRAMGAIASARLHGYSRVQRTLGADATRIPGWLAAAEALPELSAPGGAKRWYEVALQILFEAGGGKLGGLPELAAVGEHRAGVRKRMGESARQQAGQAERAIQERFEMVFLARYRTA